MFLGSAGHLPSIAYMNRRSYERICAARERREARQMLKRLEQQKLIAVRKRGEDVVITLSAKGKTAALKQHLKNISKKLPRGTYCLVSFDIPEDVQGTRRVLRDFLKYDLGFEKIHKSVWRCNYDIVKELRELIHILKIEDWVKIFRVHEEE